MMRTDGSPRQVASHAGPPAESPRISAEPRCISDLDALVAALSAGDRARFERIFHLCFTEGDLRPPEAMHAWLANHFGSVDAVRRQRIVKVTNKVTLEGALFNALRARRPLQAPAVAGDLEERIDNRECCDFCSPLEHTPADIFGRIQGQHCLTASNVAKYDGWHAVIVFDEHHPLRLTADRVADCLDTAQRWARTAHETDPGACYPFFLWNCLWRSGASILHGHAQMALTRDMHYAQVEGWRQAALRYRAAHSADYFSDLVAIQRTLGLALDRGSATIFPSLTPFKEKETHIVARHFDDDLKSAIFWVLDTFVQRMGVQSFNLALYQPPLDDTPEDWTDFPYVVRIVDRGRLDNNNSDVGAMEFFAQSVVATDPFRVADVLHLACSSPAAGGYGGGML
jgi:galactose-1-phosphate uridylyltransferase